MAVQQVAESVQNDGNFSQLDLKDLSFGGPLMRIETFRCSQPVSDYGTTRACTEVRTLAGLDHLKEWSNRTFRHVFSISDDGSPKVTLEMREIFDEDGSFETRTRDIDPESPSYGSVLVSNAIPRPQDQYEVHYAVREPNGSLRPRLVLSPLTEPISEFCGLCDIGADLDEIGALCAEPGNPLSTTITWSGPRSEINRRLAPFEAFLSQERFARFRENIQAFERMGDFRDKCIHPGTNLVGTNPRLASEFMPIRAYRKSLIMLGRVADPAMSRHVKVDLSPTCGAQPLTVDPKPGVYAIFLSAYLNNIQIYQLGLDKVHSDFGGVPMKLAPGSRLEDGTPPVVDASRVNRTLAELAFAFYVGSTLPALPSLNRFLEVSNHRT